jgi:hypothetical protein
VKGGQPKHKKANSSELRRDPFDADETQRAEQSPQAGSEGAPVPGLKVRPFAVEALDRPINSSL